MTTTEQKENLLERAHIVAIETEASANDANRIGTLFGDIINGMGDGLTENDEDDYTDAHTLRTDKSQNLTSAEKARALQNLGIPGIATGGDFDNPTPTQRAKVPTVGSILDTGVMEGYVYDVTAMNSGTTFASLEALLSSEHLNDYIPVAKRKGGMSIKFKDSDNKYVQCRYMSSSTAVADFTNVANWQGVDEEPTADSKNITESGGIKKQLKYIAGVAFKTSKISNPLKTSGVVQTNGTINASSEFSYCAPILLKPFEKIILNYGSQIYLGTDVAVVYKCDSNGYFIKTIVAGNTTNKVVQFQTLFNGNIYIGICCYTNQLKYTFYEVDEALDKDTFNSTIEGINEDVESINNDISIVDNNNKIAFDVDSQPLKSHFC